MGNFRTFQVSKPKFLEFYHRHKKRTHIFGEQIKFSISYLLCRTWFYPVGQDKSFLTIIGILFIIHIANGTITALETR